VLRGATLAEVQALFDKYLWPLSPQRRKLSVRVVPLKGAASGADGAAAAGAAARRHGGAGQQEQQQDQEQQQQQLQHQQRHVGHAHPHHGAHLPPPLGGSPKAGSPRARRAGASAGAGGKGAAAAGKAQAAAAEGDAGAGVPILPVPTELAPDLDELKRSLGTYPALLSMAPLAARQQQ
jgi:hypothetical protein